MKNKSSLSELFIFSCIGAHFQVFINTQFSENSSSFRNVSHSHRRSNKMWKSNVKSVKVKVDGGAKKMYVCTSCLRSGKVERA